MFFYVVEFGDDPQAAVEAPRFQTRHLVSSFDNHAWNQGDLMLDERIPPSVAADLAARGHKIGIPFALGERSRAGDDPHGMPDGVIEAGADPYGYRVAHAWY